MHIYAPCQLYYICSTPPKNKKFKGWPKAPHWLLAGPVRHTELQIFPLFNSKDWKGSMATLMATTTPNVAEHFPA